MKRATPLALCLVAAMFVSAAADGGGTQSPFSLGAGGRDVSLAGSALAEADPFTAPYWNPSVLARAERISLGAFHGRLYESQTVYQYAGVAVPTMDLGGFGLGVFRLGVGGIEKRDEANYLLGEIDESRLGVYAAYGRSVTGYDVGLAVSLDHHSLDGYSATSSPGLSASVSRRWEPAAAWLDRVTAAVNGRNLIKPRMKLAEADVAPPYSMEGGVSVVIRPKPSWDHNIALSVAVAKPDMVDPCLAVGLEYSIQDRLRMRGALRDGKASFGAGLAYRSIHLDYAMVDRDLGSIHMFSLSADLSVPVGEKRRIRTEKREAEFSALVSRRLTDRNRETILNLVSRGQELIRQDDLGQASVILDRALFLAAGSGLDTMEAYQAAEDARSKVEKALLQNTFATEMDSARVRLGTGDYLGAKYFAGLALAKIPDSDEAARVLEEADSAIRRSTTKEQLVEAQLRLADSLMSYDRYDEALITLRALEGVSGDDARVKSATKKAEFGHWCVVAEGAFSRAEYSKANTALDSALSVFPGHPRCLGLRGQILQVLNGPKEAAPEVEAPSSEPLGDDLRKEVEEAYRDGQRLFEQGDLPEAVVRWEKVDRLAPGYMSVRRYLVDAYKFLGVELYTQNRLGEAVDVWRKAAELDPDSSEIAGYIKRTEHEIAALEELSYESR
jgi:tetratricopeptide (TPR) repeat protein